MAHHRRVSVTVSRLNRVDRFAERSDLVDFHKDAVRNALGDPFTQTSRVCDEQIVADKLDRSTDSIGQ